LTPNVAEVERASGRTVDQPEALAQAVQTLLQHSQAEAMLVTRGKEGLSLFHPPQAAVHIAARARDVFDMTGAGDTVTAVFTMALLNGCSMVEAARVARGTAHCLAGRAFSRQPENCAA
jgi:bifunctional ADP-heptose synthase (sugar kinase/adenylyltransferase)